MLSAGSGILSGNRKLLEKMAELLLEKETVDSKEITDLINGYADEEWRKVAAENSADHERAASLTD
jgi:hypothetical protein